MDWQAHFENSEPYGGIWCMTDRFRETESRHCSETRPVGGPPSSGRTRWQHWLRYGSRISWYLRVGPDTKVPGGKSCLPFPRENCHSLVCTLPHTCHASVTGPPLFLFFPRLQFSPTWLGTAGAFVIHIWSLVHYVPSALKHNILLAITSHRAWHILNTQWVFSKWMNESSGTASMQGLCKL